ncbi:hypothetical protein GCM10010245_82330 [Streptomyces spectabilis]|nr:hypothetical protein GCM10010245_82330 [Streptomyces spectabilis]
MTAQLRPWRPEDFAEPCEGCGAPPGQLCRPWCDAGYTADCYRRDAERRAPTASSTDCPKE